MKRSLAWASAAGVIAAFAAALAPIVAKILPEGKPEPTLLTAAATITSPVAQERVGPRFRVVGSTTAVPDGRSVWLAVQHDQLLWPKEPRLRPHDRNWSQVVEEFGNPSDGMFTLVLFHVSPAGDTVISEWFETGRRTGNWPGLRPDAIHGYAQLFVVPSLRLQ